MKVSHKHYASRLARNLDICSGNVISDCQFSMFLTKTRASDHNNGIPRYCPYHWRKRIEELAHDHNQVNYYLLRHTSPSTKRVVLHGFIVTACHGNDLLCYRACSSQKSQEIVDYAKHKLALDSMRYNTIRANVAFRACNVENEART